MINIQKSYSVHFGPFGPFCPLRSMLVLLGPFGSHWSYSIHFSHIRSILVIFNPLNPLWFYLVDIASIWSILSYSAIWSYLFLFGPYFHFGPNISIHSYSVQLIPIWSYYVHLVHFTPFGPFGSTLVHFYALTYNEKICLVGWEYLF